MTRGEPAGEIGPVEGRSTPARRHRRGDRARRRAASRSPSGSGPSLFRDEDGKDRFGLADRQPAGAPHAAALPGRQARPRAQRTATSASRPAPTTPRSPCTRSATWPGSASARVARPLVAARLRPHVDHLAPASPRRATCSASRTAPPTSRPRRPRRSTSTSGSGRRRRRGRLAGRRLLPGRPPDQHDDRDLGPAAARRPGGVRRPDQGRGRAALGRHRVHRARLRRCRAATARSSPRDAHVRLVHPDSTAAPGCCAAATTSSTAPTPSAAWTPGCSSSPSSATRTPTSSRSRTRWPRPTR